MIIFIVITFVKMLYYSSFLFGTIAIHAYFICDLYYNVSFILLMGTSILNHGLMYDQNGNKIYTNDRYIIATVDRIVAHLLSFISIYHAYLLPLSIEISIYWMCLICSAYIYYIKCMNSIDPKNIWHAAIHIMSVISIHSLLIAKEQQKLTIC